MRTIKILLALAMALLCLVYAGQNLANLEATRAALAYVMGNNDHAVYPASFLPAVQHPVLVWAAAATVIVLELLAGFLLLRGTFAMWRARDAVPADFHAAKKWVYLGAGVGMLVWFGLFHVIGGAVFQMWQTAAGAGSLGGAFWYGGILALGALFIAQVPET